MPAKVALRKIIWQGDPKRDKDGNVIRNEINDEVLMDRVEILPGQPVPKTVPVSVQVQWEQDGLVMHDEKVDAPNESPGPPIKNLPIGFPPEHYKQIR